MKADLVTREPQRLEKWLSGKLYERIQEKRAGREKFVLHDGPPFANGDVHSAASADLIMRETNCAGLMIGRAGAGNPWLFTQIRSEVLGEPWFPPTRELIIQVFLEHVERLAALQDEKLAVLQSRKLAKYYFKPFPDAAQLTAKIQTIETMAALKQFLA